LREDVAGATFMAMATSSPELVISCVGTFITGGDIGVGTIVGSAVFNVLAVPACCGLFTRTAIQLEWWSLSRDCIYYALSVFALIAVTYDNEIMWYEAAFLVTAYGFYLISKLKKKNTFKNFTENDENDFIAVMYKDDGLSDKVRLLARKLNRRFRHQLYQEVTEITPLFNREKFAISYDANDLVALPELSEPFTKISESNEDERATSPWKIPASSNPIQFILRWPITFTLWCTIPDSRRFKRFYILTFINCVCWIGCVSYYIVFISTDVGEFIN
jgi:solute carrier family 24 (sodium/potassium/calcium exchanger), member 4